MTATGFATGSKVNERPNISDNFAKKVKDSTETSGTKTAVQFGKDTANQISATAKAIAGKAVGMVSFGDDFGFISKYESPKEVVNKIRDSKGSNRDEALLGFQNKIDKMPSQDLKDMRNYMVHLMSSETNNDDELLGSMLTAVNRELDSRKSDSNIIDIIGRPMPLPGGCFPPPINKTDFEKYMLKF